MEEEEKTTTQILKKTIEEEIIDSYIKGTIDALEGIKKMIDRADTDTILISKRFLNELIKKVSHERRTTN